MTAPAVAGPSLKGKRAIVTQANDFMGPALVERLSAHGAVVFSDDRDLRDPSAADALIDEAGHVDVLVANLMLRNPRSSVTDTTDEQWKALFEAMVHPLHSLVRAVLPQMIARRSGKIVVMGSANALRGSAPRAAYSAARGAQIAYVKSAGVEAAPHNVQINAIAQNFVSNPTSYPREETTRPEFTKRLEEVPVGRLAEGWESAALAVFLAGPRSDFFVGQVFPLAGGWVA
ncbi:SDR family oxidoreductase [Aestuariivirga sp.]|uniref:SDR family oxidoreductase n=1 Tax=Aestuariivirga sp. TaxID=2650926 RepID=UPI00391BCFA5